MLSDNKRDFLINRTVDKLTQYLVTDYNFSLAEAMNTVYNSRTYSLLKDESTALFIESPSYMYEKIKEEISSQR